MFPIDPVELKINLILSLPAFTTQQAVGWLETLSGTLSGTLLETLPAMEKSMGKGFVQRNRERVRFRMK